MVEKLFSTIANEEFAWPKGDDKLAPPADWPRAHHAVGYLDGITAHSRSIFISGYRAAAEAVIDSVVDKKSHPNFVVWPILMLYRHAIELGLKDCIEIGARALGEPLDIDMNEHWLRVLLDKLCQQSDELFPNEGRGALKGFASIVRAIDAVDPNGQVTRYPADLDGEVFKIDRNNVDLLDLKVKMQKVLNFLSGHADAAYDLAQCYREDY